MLKNIMPRRQGAFNFLDVEKTSGFIGVDSDSDFYSVKFML